MKSRPLGCFLGVVGAGDDLRLRVGAGPRGDDLFPTGEEAEAAAKEEAVVSRDTALGRIAVLEAELRKARRSRR